MYNCISDIKINRQEVQEPKIIYIKKSQLTFREKKRLARAKRKEKITSKKKSNETVKNRRKNKQEKKKKLCTLRRNRMTVETEKKRTKRLRSFERWPGQSCPKYCHTFSFVFSLCIGVIQF